jgi:hypothetical protein
VTLGSVIGIAIFLDVHEVLSDLFRGAAVIRPSTSSRSPRPPVMPIPTMPCGQFFAPLWMLFLSSFATSAGSTGGGIKMIRAIVLYKQVYRELTRAMHPNAVHPIKIGRAEVVPPNILFAVLAFGFMYMVCIVSMTLLLSLLRARNHHRLLGGDCQHQQYRTGFGQGRSGDQLRCLTDFPDLGVHLCHAPRSAGDLYLAGRPDAGFLAQVATKGG